MELVDVTDSKAASSTKLNPWLPLDFSRVSGYTVFQDFPSSLLSSLLSPGVDERLSPKTERRGTLRKDTCRCDGIGRRSGFKIRRQRWRVGSSPTTGTTWKYSVFWFSGNRVFPRFGASSLLSSLLTAVLRSGFQRLAWMPGWMERAPFSFTAEELFAAVSKWA